MKTILALELIAAMVWMGDFWWGLGLFIFCAAVTYYPVKWWWYE